MTRDSFVFYVDWEEAIDNIADPEIQLAYYRALVKYALHGIEPPQELKGLGITLAMRQMDRDYAKYLEQKARSRRAGKASAAKRLSEYAAEEAKDAPQQSTPQPQCQEPQHIEPQQIERAQASPLPSQLAADNPAQAAPPQPAEPQPASIPAAQQLSPAEQEEAYYQQYFSDAEEGNRTSLLRMLTKQNPDITTGEHLSLLAERIIQRWRRSEKRHRDYRDFSTHMDSSLLQMSVNTADIQAIIKSPDEGKKDGKYKNHPEWYVEAMRDYVKDIEGLELEDVL